MSSTMIFVIVAVVVLAALVWVLWSDRRRLGRRRPNHAGAHDPKAPDPPPGDGFAPNQQWGGPPG